MADEGSIPCAIRRIAITAPITAIAFDITHNTLYTASGGQLIAYKNIGVQDESVSIVRILPIDLFSTHTIHGMKYVPCNIPKVVVFGGKAVSIVTIPRKNDIQIRCSSQLAADSIETELADSIETELVVGRTEDEFCVEMLLEDLDDLVLDCLVIENILLIGFAHNFIDVIITNTLINVTCKAQNLLYRVQCSDISALFSLSIAACILESETEKTKKIFVASGTAFGKIILWNFDVPICGRADDEMKKKKELLAKESLSKEAISSPGIPLISIENVLTNHEGIK